MIQVHQLSKQYKRGEWALNDLDLTIGNGMFGLLGPNGAGKTTLIRILATLMKPTTGDVIVDQISLLQKPEVIRRQIGYLPQLFQVYPQLTGYEFLDYIAVMKGMHDRTQRKLAIDELLERVNLQSKAHKKIRTYSGGMKQRLGIAQALIGDPKIIIVDEPTAGLDPEERVRFRNLLAQFSIDRTIILSTHIVADIESSCRQVAVLNRGKLAFSGKLQELIACAQGKVWEIEVTERQFASMMHLHIVSTRRFNQDYICRVVAESPPASDAILLDPTLEDGYLALIGGEDR